MQYAYHWDPTFILLEQHSGAEFSQGGEKSLQMNNMWILKVQKEPGSVIVYHTYVELRANSPIVRLGGADLCFQNQRASTTNPNKNRILNLAQSNSDLIILGII